ncbi:hypothetical protein F7C95_01315 [Opitutia bacterium ISCC 51]|nr:hypothetical protein F7C95_01315 [Opitutae bacterium ISCC 51]QXD28649.1 hypothetical protein GA003_01310 [Opitutae bacterium ISCC 52]
MEPNSDEQFTAAVEKYYQETLSFRYQLDNRTEEELVRDDYVLDQYSQGKRLKVVLRKASKKLNLPDLAPDSPQHAAWIKYYQDLMAIIANDMKIEAYQKSKANSDSDL